MGQKKKSVMPEHDEDEDDPGAADGEPSDGGSMSDTSFLSVSFMSDISGDLFFWNKKYKTNK